MSSPECSVVVALQAERDDVAHEAVRGLEIVKICVTGLQCSEDRRVIFALQYIIKRKVLILMDNNGLWLCWHILQKKDRELIQSVIDSMMQILGHK